MEIRKSKLENIDEIMNIYSLAKSYMVAHGNVSQWADGYPQENIIRSDIINENNYVILNDDEIVATFTFIIGDDPTYQIIRNGNWHSDKTYGTIHRLASNGKIKGIAKACFSFCAKQIDYIRIDTHADNIIMQKTIENFGFQKCGNIYVRDGSERIAFDYLKY